MTNFLLGTEGKEHPDRCRLNGKLGLKLHLKKYGLGLWADLISFRIDSRFGCFENFSELLISIRNSEFF
jgi:hypothetical protein